MTINQAIRILDPDTSAEALGEIDTMAVCTAMRR